MSEEENIWTKETCPYDGSKLCRKIVSGNPTTSEPIYGNVCPVCEREPTQAICPKCRTRLFHDRKHAVAMGLSPFTCPKCGYQDIKGYDVGGTVLVMRSEERFPEIPPNGWCSTT